jgi:hypothetical protein
MEHLDHRDRLGLLDRLDLLDHRDLREVWDLLDLQDRMFAWRWAWRVGDHVEVVQRWSHQCTRRPLRHRLPIALRGNVAWGAWVGSM